MTSQLTIDHDQASNPTIDISKFSRVCGILGSDFDSERAAAALAATRMLADCGMTWSELFESVARKTDSQPTAKRSKDNGIPAADLILVCNDCSTEALSRWDKAFLKSLAEIAERFGANVALSEKQWNHLWRIYGLLGADQ